MTPLDTDAGRAVVEAMVHAFIASQADDDEAADLENAWLNATEEELRECRRVMEPVLLAALAVRTREPCPQPSPHSIPGLICPSCDGSGTVPGVPALVELLMEPLDDPDFFSEYQLELLNGESAYIVRPLPRAAQ